MMNAEELKPMWYDAADLWTELKETQKVRDEWCAEYTRVRDELEALKQARTVDRAAMRALTG